MKLVYIANARLPTEKAHGYQIVKMCEAFARRGAGVTLMHPRRHQHDPRLKAQSAFDYYGVEPVFRIWTLRNADVIRLETLIPRRLFGGAFFTHALLWGLYAASVARRDHATVYYTRDIIVAYWLTRKGLPTVLELHVIPNRASLWMLARLASSPSLRLAVTITSFIQRRLVEIGFGEEKTIVCPDGVDLSLFENVPSKEECRRLLGLPAKNSIVGYIGRFQTLEQEKGIPELVRSMAQMNGVDGREPLLLCVGGPMEQVPHYLALAATVGVSRSRIRFHDRVPNHEVPMWIRACDVVTIPWPWTEFSAYFTSPLKLFEYMAAGVPIVASDLPSIREVLRHGENAWLVKPGNPQELARGIRHVLHNGELAAQLSQRAREDVLPYSWQSRAGRILEAFESASLTEGVARTK